MFGVYVAKHVAALRAAGAHVEVAAIRGIPVHSRIASKYLRLAFDALSSVVRTAIRRRRIRIVEAHIAYPTGLIAWPIARILGAKLVLFCHGSDVTRLGLASRSHHRLARFALARADLVVANSQFVAGVVKSQYGITGEKVVVWSPGIDTLIFKPSTDVARDPREILFVGRLDGQKGLAVLLTAAARIGDPSITVRIIGDGPDRQALQDAADGLCVAASFDGSLDAHAVAAAMARTGVLVVPSTSAEGLGLVALEGMATGALVVASAAGGLVESVVPGVTGWLVAPGDAAALTSSLTEALQVAASPPSASAAMRQAAIDRAAPHDIWAGGINSLREYSRLVSC
jgi:glycosyltransferase involved in cell wall biosynthesis